MKAEIKPVRKIMGRLAKGADLLGALEEQCRLHKITLGEVWAIGAVTKARIGYYQQDIQKYMFLDLDRPHGDPDPDRQRLLKGRPTHGPRPPHPVR